MTPSSIFFPLPHRERTRVRILKRKYTAFNSAKVPPFGTDKDKNPSLINSLEPSPYPLPVREREKRS